PLSALFFCQAEDGIRDFHVTGVQTCALPIWWKKRKNPLPRLSRTRWLRHGTPADKRGCPRWLTTRASALTCWAVLRECIPPATQIGRASCRDRGYGPGGRGSRIRHMAVDGRV